MLKNLKNLCSKITEKVISIGIINTIRLVLKKSVTAGRLIISKGLGPTLKIAVDKYSTLMVDKLPAVESAVESKDRDDYLIWMNGSIEKESDVLVYLAYTPDGCLSSIHQKQINDYLAAGFNLITIINTPVWFSLKKNLQEDQTLAKSKIVMVRDNSGYDFGGWAQLLRVVSDFRGARTISFTNDSILTIDDIKLEKLRLKIRNTDDAWFLTENRELQPHGQSYFFGFKENLLNSVVGHLSSIPIYREKWDLIFNVELHLSNIFTNSGLKVNFLFDVSSDKHVIRDKSIKDWEELIQNGFPFLKIQLFQKDILKFDDPKIIKLIGLTTVNDLKEHLNQRLEPVNAINFAFGKVLEPSMAGVALHDTDGVLQSYNTAACVNPSLVLPFAEMESIDIPPKKILIILHAYYEDLAKAMLEQTFGAFERIANVSFDLVITTDQKGKAKDIKTWILNSGYSKNLLEVVCLPNRGRNVAPFLIACKKYIKDQDLILHLHTKKSPHDPNLNEWNDYLTNTLVGSSENLKSILAMFEVDNLGLVFAGHHKSVYGLRNWGYDFNKAQHILSQSGIWINADDALDFPTGMMFWARPDALRSLFELDLMQSDFDPEQGQIDGTLAHSIERSINHFVELHGYKTQSVISADKIESHGGANMRLSYKNSMSYLNNIQSNLRNIAKQPGAFNIAIQEIYDISFARSQKDRKRLNIILPSVEPFQIYGGVATAIEEGIKLWRSMGKDTDLRFLITLDDTTRDGLSELAQRIGETVIKTKPFFDEIGISLVSIHADRYLPLSVRSGDIYFATAWWTADLGFRLRSAQLDFFESAANVVYLVQDYEPMFYGLGVKYSLAKNTYCHSNNTTYIFNSEELANYFLSKHNVENGYYLPYGLNKQLQSQISAFEKQKMILVYGRPTVERNAFSIIVEGLRRWQSSMPDISREWQIIFAGEWFDPVLISELSSSKVVGKVTMKEYAELLSKASIGISLMLSPHPSYPPLEMCSAGVQTITNTFDFKDLSARSIFCQNLDQVSPVSIARKLDKLVTEYCPNRDSAIYPIKKIPCSLPEVSYNLIAEHLKLD